MAFTINFAEIPDQNLIPAGKYPVVITNALVKANQAGDGYFVDWELQVADGEFQGRKLRMITSLKPQALWKLKGVLKSIGVPTDGTLDFDVDPDSKTLLSPQVVGLAGTAVVKIETYEGTERSRVDDLLPSNSGETPAIAASNKRPQTGKLKLR